MLPGLGRTSNFEFVNLMFDCETMESEACSACLGHSNLQKEGFET